MYFDDDYKDLGYFPLEVIQPLAELAKTVDWDLPELQRNDRILIHQMVRVPYKVRQEPSQTTTEVHKIILEKFWPIHNYMQELYPDHIFIKGEINWSRPGSKLQIHRDPNVWHGLSNRIHVPIITNQNAFIVVENRFYHFSIGRYYELNNRKFHSVVNNGETGRLHCVFDVMPEMKFKETLDNNIDINLINIDRNNILINEWNELEEKPNINY